MHPETSPRKTEYDVLVAGGGPAGATTALALARAGVSVLVAERATFPRFHVGESLLPRNLPLFDELGLRERLDDLPHTPKYGAEFAFGHEAHSLRFDFADGLLPDQTAETVNVERASFDAMLLDAAAEAGAEVVQGAGVGRVEELTDGAVSAHVGDHPVRARYLVDASGQSTLLGKHLGLRRGYDDHNKVACFGHFRGVGRLPGRDAGHPCIAMLDDAWFWLIALDGERTSVGVVMDREVAHRVRRDHDVPASGLLRWAVPRAPFVARRMAAAEALGEQRMAADYSYRCAPYAAPGCFLVGDAATFLDPIFSTGICLGMVGGQQAAAHLVAILDGADPAAERRAYRRFIERSTAPVFRLIEAYYRHPFRELLMNGEGPLDVHRALFTLLSGHIFPRPPWPVRWRQRLMEAFVPLQERFGLVPRHERYSLETAEAGRTPTSSRGSEGRQAGGGLEATP